LPTLSALVLAPPPTSPATKLNVASYEPPPMPLLVSVQ
jgi:hypothetical protein